MLLPCRAPAQLLPSALAVFSAAVIFLVYLPSTFFLLHRPFSLLVIPPLPPEIRSDKNSSRFDLGIPSNRNNPRLDPAGYHTSDPGSGIRRPEIISESSGFHDKESFLEDYREMKKNLKIYIYSHNKQDPYAHALLPVNFLPGGNYASESYFKKLLHESQFITSKPSEADFFFLPFSISRLRHDPRVEARGISDFVQKYMIKIIHDYPFWNRTGGVDHFYVACHSAGRSAMEKAQEIKLNAIQVVCSASYFLSGYVPHKDLCLPQIWPRKGNLPGIRSTQRSKLAFFAGSINSPVREALLKSWENNSDIIVHHGRLPTSYSKALLDSKFCLHVKGFEVNTARVSDAIFHGCVPIIIANHYDLPFGDILDWKSFSLIVPTLDIPLLKIILQRVTLEEYSRLHRNLLKVRRHFQWHPKPRDYDAFYMVLYEIWLRRGILQPTLS